MGLTEPLPISTSTADPAGLFILSSLLAPQFFSRGPQKRESSIFLCMSLTQAHLHAAEHLLLQPQGTARKRGIKPIKNDIYFGLFCTGSSRYSFPGLCFFFSLSSLLFLCFKSTFLKGTRLSKQKQPLLGFALRRTLLL